MINVTGDPNQGNRTMFGLGFPYQSSSVDFPVSSAIEIPTNVGQLGIPPQGERTNCATINETPMSYPFVPTSNSLIPPMNIPAGVNSFPFPASQPFNHFSFSPSDSFINSAQSSLSISSPIVSQAGYASSSHFVTSQGCNSRTVSSYYSAPIVSSRALVGSFRCKRKGDTEVFPPAKQHITEEHMAEHMSKLHISSETPICIGEAPPTRERRLYMCDEMRRLQAESIIPAQLLAKVQRPCTALVPWTPPVVPPLAKENNNNEEEPDNNQDMPGSSRMDMEL